MNQHYTFEDFNWKPLFAPNRLNAIAECQAYELDNRDSFADIVKLAIISCSAPAAMIAFVDHLGLLVCASEGFTNDDLQFVANHVLPNTVIVQDPVYTVNADKSAKNDEVNCFVSMHITIDTELTVGLFCIGGTDINQLRESTDIIVPSLTCEIQREFTWRRRLFESESTINALRRSELNFESKVAGMSLLNEIGSAARSADDPNSILAMAVNRLGQVLSADRCYYANYNTELGQAEISHEWFREGLEPIHAVYDTFQVSYNRDPNYFRGRTSKIEDILKLPSDAGTAFAMKLGIRSLLRAPIQRGSTMTALAVTMSTPRSWTDDEIQLVEAVASQTRAAVESAGHLIRQKALLRDVLVTVTDGKLQLVELDQKLPKPLTPVGHPVHLDRSGGLSQLRDLSRLASSMANHTEERSYDFMMAVGEAGMNAIVHAKVGLAVVSVGQQGTVQVKVTDEGSGIAFENIPKATLTRGYSTKASLGHGLKMMLETVDRIFLLTGPGGTTVVIEQDREVRESEWDVSKFA